MSEIEQTSTELELLENVGKSLQKLVHDANNHLANALGQAQMIALKLGLSELTPETAREIAERSDRIVGAVRACERLFSRYRDFYRPPSVAAYPARLGPMLAQALERARARWPEAVLVVEAPDDVLESEVMADPDRLIDALAGVLDNAVIATYEKPAAQVRCLREGDRVRIEVRDEGVGLTAQQLTGAFEPFRTWWTHAPGFGLGLGSARHVVEQCGGQIELLSDGLGQGAACTILLPVDGQV